MLTDDAQQAANAERDIIAEWLEDRARLLTGFDDFAALELSICAQAVRESHLLLGGIIACSGQPYPTNGGEQIA